MGAVSRGRGLCTGRPSTVRHSHNPPLSTSTTNIPDRIPKQGTIVIGILFDNLDFGAVYIHITIPCM